MNESGVLDSMQDKDYYTRKCLDEIASRVRKCPVPINLDACESLDDYGLYFGTDKSSCLHNLCDEYERFLSAFRKRKFNLVEFGILNCASINMWSAYFPNATIIGIDPNGDSVKAQRANDNIIIIPHDAYDQEFINNVFAQYPPLVVIDDATHYWSHQIAGFEAYFPAVLPGGFYIVEDIETSYGDFRKGIWADQELDGASYFLGLAARLSGSDSQEIHPLSGSRETCLPDDLAAITFIKDAVVISKK